MWQIKVHYQLFMKHLPVGCEVMESVTVIVKGI